MRFITVAAVFLLTLACLRVEARYETLEDARAAGAIERGWIPSWMPSTSYDIREAHDLDTNASIVAASYEDAEHFDWAKHCERVDPRSPPPPSLRRRWWPRDVPAPRFATAAYSFAQCGPSEFVAWANGRIYHWRAGT